MFETMVSAAMRQADTLQRGPGWFAQLFFRAGILPEMKRIAGMRPHRKRDIVERGEIEEQRRDLERARQPLDRAHVGRQRGDVLAGEGHQIPSSA